MSVVLNFMGKDMAYNFVKESYVNNGNLAVQITYFDEECEYWMPWCMLTTNLGEKLEPDVAYLDTNNCPETIIAWLYKNRYIIPLGISQSGFCTYPCVRFSKAFMDTILIEED